MKKRLYRILVALAFGLILAAVIAYLQVQNETATRSATSAGAPSTAIVEENFGGSFTLVNQDGKTVTEADFDNKWRMIYFGFTYCPAICPTELQKISQALNMLGEKGEKIIPVFITVDPERDDVETMKNYVEMFHPRLVGLTGTPEQIEQAKKVYKIYSAKVQDETMSDYTVDHSSFIYLIDPENNLRRIFKINDTPQQIADFADKVL
jgi:protein SCO1/2